MINKFYSPISSSPFSSENSIFLSQKKFKIEYRVPAATATKPMIRKDSLIPSLAIRFPPKKLPLPLPETINR